MNTLDKSEVLNHVIQQRKSVFPSSYVTKEIPKPIIQQLLENADRAPTHKLTQPWRFKVLRGEKKNAFGEFMTMISKKTAPPGLFSEEQHQKHIRKAHKCDTIIAVCMQRHKESKLPEWEEIAATAMAVQNIYLSCTAYGIGCYWSSPGLAAYYPEFHPLAEDERCLGFIYMGYYDRELPLSQRESLETKVEWL